MLVLDGNVCFDPDKESHWVTADGRMFLDLKGSGVVLGGRHKNVNFSTVSAIVSHGPRSTFTVYNSTAYAQLSNSVVQTSGGVASPGEIRSDWQTHGSGTQTVTGMFSSQGTGATIDCILTGVRSSSLWFRPKVTQTATKQYTVALHGHNGSVITPGPNAEGFIVDVFTFQNNENITQGDELTELTNRVPFVGVRD